MHGTHHGQSPQSYPNRSAIQRTRDSLIWGSENNDYTEWNSLMAAWCRNRKEDSPWSIRREFLSQQLHSVSKWCGYPHNCMKTHQTTLYTNNICVCQLYLHKAVMVKEGIPTPWVFQQRHSSEDTCLCLCPLANGFMPNTQLCTSISQHKSRQRKLGPTEGKSR